MWLTGQTTNFNPPHDKQEPTRMLCQELVSFLETSLKPCSRHGEIVSEFIRITSITDAATLETVKRLAVQDDTLVFDFDPPTIAKWNHDLKSLMPESKFLFAVLVFYHANRPGWDVFSALDAAIYVARHPSKDQMSIDLDAA
jgi:hypothetical protein